MKQIDFERAALLLDVVAKVTNIGPMNQPILGEAQEELRQIVADCNSNRAERADKIRAEEQVAAQQQLKAQQDDAAVNAEAEPEPVEEAEETSTAPTLVDRRM